MVYIQDDIASSMHTRNLGYALMHHAVGRHVYMHTCMQACVCVCVCVRARIHVYLRGGWGRALQAA